MTVINKYMQRSSEKEKSRHSGVFFFFSTNSKLTLSQSISIKEIGLCFHTQGFFNSNVYGFWDKEIPKNPRQFQKKRKNALLAEGA